MGQMGSFSKMPGGNIRASRFVALGTANTVTECGANGDAWGISAPWVRNNALAGYDDGLAAVAGDPPLMIYGPGDDECQLVLGGTIAAGQRIKSDANGAVVLANTAGDKSRAVALRAGVAGDLIPVKPQNSLI